MFKKLMAAVTAFFAFAVAALPAAAWFGPLGFGPFWPLGFGCGFGLAFPFCPFGPFWPFGLFGPFGPFCFGGLW